MISLMAAVLIAAAGSTSAWWGNGWGGHGAYPSPAPGQDISKQDG